VIPELSEADGSALAEGVAPALAEDEASPAGLEACPLALAPGSAELEA
jgi:hypothetical protein